MTWKHRVLISKLREGCTHGEAAATAGVRRETAWRWVKSSPDFAAAVAEARQAGQQEREFRLWLRHPFRGRRPPTGKGHGGKPSFNYGRR